eukprot:TRINITY_DN90926_c0_g1_i1.p1 TRINITY_DN90926_c0_g1~~TRINITY_DN90926_c0_g1_i1.p1  ORF type:complete len:492 (+),score=46.56 TRINITY_DN90926_c0_g1_i1:153-1478(+)
MKGKSSENSPAIPTKVKATLILDIGYLLRSSKVPPELFTIKGQFNAFLFRLGTEILDIFRLLPSGKLPKKFHSKLHSYSSVAFCTKCLVYDPNEPLPENLLLDEDFIEIPASRRSQQKSISCLNCGTNTKMLWESTSPDVVAKLAIELYKCSVLSKIGGNKSQELVVIVAADECYEAIIRTAKDLKAATVLAKFPENIRANLMTEADAFVDIGKLLETHVQPDLNQKGCSLLERTVKLAVEQGFLPVEKEEQKAQASFFTIGLESAPSELTQKDYQELLEEINVRPRYVWITNDHYHFKKKYVRIFCREESEAEKVLQFCNRRFKTPARASYKKKEECPPLDVCRRLDQELLKEHHAVREEIKETLEEEKQGITTVLHEAKCALCDTEIEGSERITLDCGHKAHKSCMGYKGKNLPKHFSCKLCGKEISSIERERALFNQS